MHKGRHPSQKERAKNKIGIMDWKQMKMQGIYEKNAPRQDQGTDQKRGGTKNTSRTQERERGGGGAGKGGGGGKGEKKIERKKKSKKKREKR